jgi:CheY-like chemotaxis protein
MTSAAPDTSQRPSPLASAIKGLIEEKLPNNAASAAEWMSTVLGMKAGTSSYRKLRLGRYSDSELQTLADALKMTLPELLMDVARRLATGSEEAVTAYILLNGETMRARVFLNEDTAPWMPESLVVAKREGKWWVVSAAQSAGCEEVRGIASIVHDRASKPRVALLDDDRDVIDFGKELLEAQGWLCSAFRTSRSLAESLRTTTYNAFVLDWQLAQGETCESIVRTIRRREGGEAVPILLITGAVEADGGSRTEAVTQLVKNYRVLVKQKPVNWRLLAGEMEALTAGQALGTR